MARRAAVLILVLILVFICCLLQGSTGISLAAAMEKGSVDHIILFSVRLPRVMACFFAGLAFAASGCLLQAATGNELASGNVIGINSGAGFAVLLVLSLAPGCFALLPLAAFLGALSAALLVFSVSSLAGARASGSPLILSGVAVNALFNALISTTAALEPDVMSSYSAFSIGGFSMLSASQLPFPFAIIAVCCAVTVLLSRSLDIIRLGDDLASSMGLRPLRTRLVLIALACLLCASAVSYCGLLGFVGLVTPHLASMLTGGGGRKTVLLSLVIGPALVMLSDLLARLVIAPAELPAGVFMAALGVPFFVVLLITGRKKC